MISAGITVKSRRSALILSNCKTNITCFLTPFELSIMALLILRKNWNKLDSNCKWIPFHPGGYFRFSIYINNSILSAFKGIIELKHTLINTQISQTLVIIQGVVWKWLRYSGCLCILGFGPLLKGTFAVLWKCYCISFANWDLETLKVPQD